MVFFCHKKNKGYFLFLWQFGSKVGLLKVGSLGGRWMGNFAPASFSLASFSGK